MDVSSAPATISLRPGGTASGISLRPGGGNKLSLRPGGGAAGAANLRARLGGGGGDLGVSPAETRKPGSTEKIQYTADELLKLREKCTQVPEGLANAAPEILVGASSAAAEPDWGSRREAADSGSWERQQPAAATATAAAAGKPAEPDNRDWKKRSDKPPSAPPPAGDDWNKGRAEARGGQDGGYRGGARPQQGGGGGGGGENGPALPIVKAANPWAPARGPATDKERLFRAIKGILNKLTPEKFEVLFEQVKETGINTAELLQGTISLVFDKAVREPHFCPMYAELCARMAQELPEFPDEENPGKPITFRRVLLNTCQEEFEGADNMRAQIREMLNSPEQAVEREEMEKKVKLRTLGNIKLIGELFKQKMTPEKIVHACIQLLLGDGMAPVEENIEALCQLLTTVGKLLEESIKSKPTMDAYFKRIRDLTTSPALSSRVRFLVRDLLDLRSAKWVPRRVENKAKTIDQIHAEAAQQMGMRPGALSGLRNGRGAAGATAELLFPPGPSHPGSGARMPGMPPGMPSMPNVLADLDGFEVVARGGRKGKKPEPAGAGLLRPGSGAAAPDLAALGMAPARGLGSFNSKPSALLGNFAAGPPPSTTPAPAPAAVVAPPKTSAAPAKPAPAAKSKGGLSDEELKRKAESLVKEFFSVGDLKEAALCVRELNSPIAGATVVETAVSLALDAKERERESTARLLNHLCPKEIPVDGLLAGLSLLAGSMEDLVYDLPKAPHQLGELVGRLAIGGGLKIARLTDICEALSGLALKREVAAAALGILKTDKGVEEGLKLCKADGLSLKSLLQSDIDNAKLVDQFSKLGLEGFLKA